MRNKSFKIDTHSLLVPQALGTWPVIVDDNFAIKFFPRLGDDGEDGDEGRTAYHREVTSYATLTNLSEELKKLINQIDKNN